MNEPHPSGQLLICDSGRSSFTVVMQLLSTPGIGLFGAAALLFALGAGGCDRIHKSAAPASTDRAAFLAGASGELIQPNFFIEDLRGLSKSLSRRGWQVSVAAGSKNGELSGSIRASNAHILQGVQRTLESVKAGGQALIFFHSLGRPQESQWGQRSHSIVSEDLDPSGSDIGFDLDVLEPELLKAQARGVRTALVDLSCYSGATQNLRGPACTVSLAATGYISLCSGREEEKTFSSHFLKLPDQSISLEAQFLEARRKDGESINLPQISSHATPALAGWERLLRELDPLDTFEELKNLQISAKAYDPKKLLSEVDSWISVQKPSKDLAVLRLEIAERVHALVAHRKQIEASIPELAKDYDAADLTINLEGREPLRLARASLADALDAMDAGKSPDAFTDVQRNLLKALAPRWGDLVSRYSVALAQFRARRDRFDQRVEQMEEAAGALFESERKLYDRLPVSTRTNPCRQFLL